MSALLTATFFALGAVCASFAGVLAGRLYTGQSVIGWPPRLPAGRSRCDACGRVLAAGDLVPIVSWLLARGRARCCGARISWVAPLTELGLGALFALAYLTQGLVAALAPLLLALIVLTALVLYDLAHQILPPMLLAVFVALAALYRVLATPALAPLLTALVFAAAFGAFFALLWALSGGRAMGLADAPLAAGLALMAGPAALTGFLLSFWIGAAVGIALLASPRAGATMRSEVPFAPFLAAGFLLATFTQWDPFSITALLMAAF